MTTTQTTFMKSFLEDMRYALRIFVRSPGFSAIVVMLLALGIGANTAIFSVLNALFLRELSVFQPERLVQLSGLYRNGSKVPFSFPMFEELRPRQRVFSELLGWSGIVTSNVDTNGTLSLAGVRGVTANYYSALVATPLLGRLIVPEDVGGGRSSQVAVIGHEFWNRRLGRDPTIIGKAIRIERQVFTIIGVTQHWFTGMSLGQAADVTVPITVKSPGVSPFAASRKPFRVVGCL